MLDVDARPRDPARPVVCLDEPSRRLPGEVRPPLPPGPGRPARHDPEYVRGGVANLFLVTELRRGWRHVLVSAQRTRLDWARCGKELVGVHHPEAERIVLVVDQLTTPSPASLSAACPAAEAERPADKPAIHPAPKHGSRLTMAAPELAALPRQCPARRLPDRGAVAREVAAGAARRHAAVQRIDWQVTTADARTKLRRLYPAFAD